MEDNLKENRSFHGVATTPGKIKNKKTTKISTPVLKIRSFLLGAR